MIFSCYSFQSPESKLAGSGQEILKVCLLVLQGLTEDALRS